METKFIEIRDHRTFIPALAVAVSRQDSRLARWAGYGEVTTIILIRLISGESRSDPSHWPPNGSRTMRAAHQYLMAEWDRFQNDSVCDVRVYLGEQDRPAISDICQPPKPANVS